MRNSISRSSVASSRSSARTAPARPICSKRCRCSCRAADCGGPNLAEMARSPGPGAFAISSSSTRRFGDHRLGTGLEAAPAEGRPSRVCRIDGAPATSSPSAFAEYLRLVWLTPDLDALFRGPAGERRRFLDRLVLAVDAEHGARVSALERALRSRNRILEEAPDDRFWLDAIEREVAELAHRRRCRPARGGRAARGAHPRDPGRRLAVSVRDPGARGRDRRARRRASGGRRRGPLPRHPARGPRPRPRRRPHARRPAGLRSRGAARPEGHRRRHRLDRRAEGASHRPRAGPRAARRRR